MNNLFVSNNKANSGITLLALIITVVVMLILSGIIFTSFLGESRYTNTVSKFTRNNKRTNHRNST